MKTQHVTDRAFRRNKFWYRFFRAITILTLFMAMLGAGLIAGMFAYVAKLLPAGDALTDIRPITPTYIRAIDGTVLAKVFTGGEDREIVSFDRMDKIALATIAIEDVRFNTHPGIDPRGIVRALFKNLVSGDSKEGASTITQQLARNLYLNRTKKLSRKLQEMILALEIERRYSKTEILEAYLNQVYYGTNKYGAQSWGAQMAAKNYFGKNVENLTIAQAALLAGLPKNPTGYSPYRFPKAAKERRDTVLSIMYQNQLISKQDYRTAIKEPITLAPMRRLQEMGDYHAPYFVRNVITRDLQRIFGEDADMLINRYGLDVRTSLDPRMQKIAEEAVVNGVNRNRSRHIDEGALICIDPQTGLVKAWVGGTDFRKGQYDVISQGHRQPGSAFKPFVYTTALLHGYTPTTTVNDSPRSYPGGFGKMWSPKNSDGKYKGPMQLQQALWLSRNAVAASVAYDVGIDNIIATAHNMGIKYKLEPVLSTALGASVVVPLEMASAYGTLANHGIHHIPTCVLEVRTAEGDLLYEYRPVARRAIPSKIADTMKEMMRGVIERGTARAARCPFPASGKTGTTNAFRDAWFIGYTDDLVAAVWVGNRLNQPMNHTFGGTVPAPIWKEFMLVAQRIMADEHKKGEQDLARINSIPDEPVKDAPTDYVRRQRERSQRISSRDPNRGIVSGEHYSVRICVESGDKATRWCPEAMQVTYTKGQQPTPPSRYCTIHTGPDSIPDADTTDLIPGANDNVTPPAGKGVVVSICAETGKIATDQCPTILLRRFTHGAPRETCPLHGE